MLWMPRKSTAEKLETRQRLIAAGKLEFAERGFADARFDEISLAAGYAKGTIYNYFDSKAALLHEILVDVVDRLMVVAEQLPAGSAHSRLVAIVREGNRIFAEDLALARVFTDRLASVGPVGVAAADERPRAIEWAAREFARGLESGEFQSDRSPEDLARIYAGILNAFNSMALNDLPVITFDDVPDLVDRHFLQTLRPETVPV